MSSPCQRNRPYYSIGAKTPQLAPITVEDVSDRALRRALIVSVRGAGSLLTPVASQRVAGLAATDREYVVKWVKVKGHSGDKEMSTETLAAFGLPSDHFCRVHQSSLNRLVKPWQIYACSMVVLDLVP